MRLQPSTPSFVVAPTMTSAPSEPTLSPVDIRTSLFNRTSLDRLNNRRRFPDFEENLAANPSSRFLVFSHTLQVLVLDGAPSPTLALLPRERLPLPPTPRQPASDPPLLVLGTDADDVAHLAVRLPAHFDESPWLSALPDPLAAACQFQHARSASKSLPPHQAALTAHARALFEFHARHAFCGVCGSPTVPEEGGSRRRCLRNVRAEEPATAGEEGSASGAAANGANGVPPCSGMWFPRTDPVVIMLVLHPRRDAVLLGRQKRFAPGLYSCLAGFMEHGEGVDDAVRREVEEEAGVRVGRVRFFGSQAWPFPFSLMLGCVAVADADSDELRVDEHELEHAQWFSREEVVDMVASARKSRSNLLEGQNTVPPPTSIAGQMLEAYARNDPITSFKLPTQAGL